MHEETIYKAYLIDFMSFQMQLCQLDILAITNID